MRKALNNAGRGTCARCGISYLASALDVDHIHPIHKGGEDVEDNVQALCKHVCHAHKTRADCGYAPLSF
ncbi:HNH endonuclease signature motif containing protein [Streptomyces sp. NPDC006540]|uniref:HNH endonuclease n=1 Tax=Streptomyces sp. NPDC006540 TaxID=3155353 RepID=UPI00339EB6D9